MPLFRYSAAARRRVLSEFRCFSDRAAQVNEAGPLACRLKSRSVIGFRGPDCIKFLQGLLTNDVRPLGQGSSGDTAGEGSQTSYAPTPNVAFHRPPPIYAAMLTPQGRFLYDFFLYRPPNPEQKLDRTGSGPASDGSEDGPAVLADVDSTVLEEILDCFKKYRLRANVEIENLSGDFTCWQRFSGNLAKDTSSVQEPEAASVGWGGGVDLTADSASQGNNLGCQWYKDPRLECLGFRGIFPSDTVPPLVEADKEAEESYYLLWRLEKGVAEGSSEIPKGEAIPLEYNLAGLNAISFDKGCYVGQELVARTHHRGVIRKRLLPFKFVDSNGKEVQQKVSPHSDIVDGNSDKKVGNVSTAIGCRGMGLVKLDEAFKDSADLRIKDQGEVRVQVFRPDWWPAEWTQAHEQRTAVA